MSDAPLLVLADADRHDLTRLVEYQTVGGYAQLERSRSIDPERVLEQLLESGIRGRGGAGFPMGRKASFLAQGTGTPTYLTVNADGSEPGTFKDREIILRVPHRLLEGCLITAHAIGRTVRTPVSPSNWPLPSPGSRCARRSAARSSGTCTSQAFDSDLHLIHV